MSGGGLLAGLVALLSVAGFAVERLRRLAR
jgi:hypothetical protein